MLGIKELRIGNYIDYYGSLLCITDFVSNSVDVENRFDRLTDLSIYDIKPIELTEDILLKCGFEYSEALFLYRLKESNLIYEYCEEEDECNYFIHFYHDGTNIIIESSNEHGEMSNMKFSHIKYLHQLQNLYFALTGKELEVKL